MIRSGKQAALLIIVIMTGAFYAVMMRPLQHVEPNIGMLVIQNKDPIQAPSQPRIWKSWQHTYIDTVDFPVAWELTHRGIGSLGVQANIFLDLNTIMVSQDGGEYEFLVITDYFCGSQTMLTLNGMPIGVHDGNRVKSVFRATLLPGGNPLAINYIKTDGVNSLMVCYRPLNTKKLYTVGHASQGTHFFVPAAKRRL
jgi:hypothetical protein